MGRKLSVGLVHGGGEGVFDESETAIRMLAAFGARATYIAVNDCGTEFPGRLHHWGSLHPDNFQYWIPQRRKNGLPMDVVYWSISKTKHVSCLVRNWRGGSSGLHGMDIALNGLKLDCAIACGIPMDARRNQFSGKDWDQFQRYRSAWKDANFNDRVRSMSGWTRTTFAPPSMAWLEKMAGRVGAHS